MAWRVEHNPLEGVLELLAENPFASVCGETPTCMATIVEWSEEDQCFVGSSPGLIYGGCHGSNEKAVFEELCQVVEEAIALYHQEGKPLPPPTSGRDYANKMQNVA